MTRYFVDSNGKYLGGFDGKDVATPANGVEVFVPPSNGADRWINGAWVAAIVVPEEVSRRKGVQQLRIEGYTEADIEAMIGTMPATDLVKDLALIEFRTSQVFMRYRPLTMTMAAMLGKDSTWLDQVFIRADALP